MKKFYMRFIFGCKQNIISFYVKSGNFDFVLKTCRLIPDVDTTVQRAYVILKLSSQFDFPLMKAIFVIARLLMLLSVLLTMKTH